MTSPLPFKIYNTLTRKVEDFNPVEPGKVGMYVCGITPYGLSHVGNARTMIVFDTFRRFLRAAGWQVKFVRNFTDIDDKIIKRAQDESRTAESVAQEFIAAFHRDMAGLNVEPADVEPLVSETLPEITAHIQRLVDRKHAYVNPENGDVLYEVATFKDYGKLANRKLDEQLAGARVEVERGKKHPFDFVLWKQAKPGEPSWPSPWGAGRPGWHIECSAMGCKHLHGDKRSFDIHGGGMDLQFPHHDCEIAQSEGAYDHRYVNYWMHVAFINMAGEKMSKSIGNIMTVEEALEKFDGRAIRLNMLMTHYRSPIDFSAESVRQAEAALRKFDYCLAAAREKLKITTDLQEYILLSKKHVGLKFLNLLAKDFDTSKAIADLFGIIRPLNMAFTTGVVPAAETERDLFLELVAGLDCLGLLPKQWPNLFTDDNRVNELLAEINEARADKKYDLADSLKARLISIFGGKVMITPEGAKWSKD